MQPIRMGNPRDEKVAPCLWLRGRYGSPAYRKVRLAESRMGMRLQAGNGAET
jgi:hypothetical protein